MYNGHQEPDRMHKHDRLWISSSPDDRTEFTDLSQHLKGLNTCYILMLICLPYISSKLYLFNYVGFLSYSRIW